MVASTDPKPFSELMPSQREGILELSADELIGIIDRIKNSDVGTYEMPLSSYPLLLKLGSAFVTMVSDTAKESGTISIAISESEAWALRGVVSVQDKIQNDAQFGIKLLRKIFLLLLSLNGLNERFSVVDAEDPDPERIKEKVKEFKELQGIPIPPEPPKPPTYQGDEYYGD